MASSLDCPGPLTQDVADAALLLAIISGQDPHDATSIQEPSLEIKPNPRLDSSLTIGIPRQYLEIAAPEIQEKIEKIISRLEKEKIKIKFISLLDPKISMAVYAIVQRAEVSSNLAPMTVFVLGKPLFWFEAEKNYHRHFRSLRRLL